MNNMHCSHLTIELTLFFNNIGEYSPRRSQGEYAPICYAMPSLFFHSVSRCDWFVASSHEFDENKQLDNESTINFPPSDHCFP